jgi:hypothetical protein
MKKAIRLWMGGHDYHDPDTPVCSSYGGVLSYEGVPVAFCYYSLVTGRHHHILSNTCPERVRRYLKDRETYEHPTLMALIAAMHENPRALSPVGTDALVLRHIENVNMVLRCCTPSAPPAFQTGSVYVDDKEHARTLTVILYRLQKRNADPIPYLVRAGHDADIKRLRGEEYWIELGDKWFGSRDLMAFTLFKIARANSLIVDLTL